MEIVDQSIDEIKIRAEIKELFPIFLHYSEAVNYLENLKQLTDNEVIRLKKGYDCYTESIVILKLSMLVKTITIKEKCHFD
jgi:hypothetical protein